MKSDFYKLSISASIILMISSIGGSEGFSPLLSPIANKINIQKARKKLRHNAEDEDDNDDPFTVTDFEAIDNLDVESHLLTMLSASLKLSFRRKLTDYVV